MTVKPLMTAREVGEVFGVDKQTVTRWAQNRKIRGSKTIGGHWRFDRDYIERLIEGLANHAPDV